MPGFKSALSSAVYHGVTRPGIRAAGKYGKGLIKKYQTKIRLKLHPPGPGGYDPLRRSRIQKATRGVTGAKASLWSKTSLAGQKRRNLAAAQMKLKRRAASGPTPTSHTGKTPGATTAPSKPVQASPAKKVKPSKAQVTANRGTPVGSVAAAVGSSRTHGELRRKLTGQVVREQFRKNPHFKGMSHKEIADQARAVRHVNKAGLRKNVKKAKDAKIREAAEVMAKKK